MLLKTTELLNLDMIKIENAKDGTITYYPLIDKKEDVSQYEPSITYKSKDGKRVVDLNLNISNVTNENWAKIDSAIKEIFLSSSIPTILNTSWWGFSLNSKSSLNP